MKRRGRLWRRHDFLLLWGGQSVSDIVVAFGVGLATVVFQVAYQAYRR